MVQTQRLHSCGSEMIIGRFEGCDLGGGRGQPTKIMMTTLLVNIMTISARSSNCPRSRPAGGGGFSCAINGWWLVQPRLAVAVAPFTWWLSSWISEPSSDWLALAIWASIQQQSWRPIVMVRCFHCWWSDQGDQRQGEAAAAAVAIATEKAVAGKWTNNIIIYDEHCNGWLQHHHWLFGRLLIALFIGYVNEEKDWWHWRGSYQGWWWAQSCSNVMIVKEAAAFWQREWQSNSFATMKERRWTRMAIGNNRQEVTVTLEKERWSSWARTSYFGGGKRANEFAAPYFYWWSFSTSYDRLLIGRGVRNSLCLPMWQAKSFGIVFLGRPNTSDSMRTNRLSPWNT